MTGRKGTMDAWDPMALVGSRARQGEAKHGKSTARRGPGHGMHGMDMGVDSSTT